MRVLNANAIDLLEALSHHPRAHFDLLPSGHSQLAALWSRHLVRLLPGDVWAVSDYGRSYLRLVKGRRPGTPRSVTSGADTNCA